jgi:glycerol-3-phosphate dehydrogenase subunit C
MSDAAEFDLMRGSLDHCVKCTICETACPFSNVTPLFPGPKYVGPQAERYRIAGDEPSPDASLDYCSSCGICTQVCPHGVHIAEMNTQAKSLMVERDGAPLRNRLLGRPTLAGRLGTPVAPLANWTLRNRPLRIAIEKTLGLHRDAPMPTFSGRTFQAWARKHRPPAAKKRIVYFHGCGANYYETRLAEMTVAVLSHNGYAVDIPKQGCCGLPLQSNGLFDDARSYVRKLAKNLGEAATGDTLIVSNSTSCSLMLKREAREILAIDDPQLRDVGSRTFDVSEFLLDLHDRGELRTDFAPVPTRVTYHAPCQQQGHGVGKPALDLMALIPGLDVVESEAACCGVAGTYGLKVEKYDISMKVGAGLFDQIKRDQAEASVCDSETCRWHIEKATGLPSVHPIEMLHRAYGLA